jgi:hypothetical protein
MGKLKVFGDQRKSLIEEHIILLGTNNKRKRVKP